MAPIPIVAADQPRHELFLSLTGNGVVFGQHRGQCVNAESYISGM